jgi:S1-C subfamily serine protease
MCRLVAMIVLLIVASPWVGGTSAVPADATAEIGHLPRFEVRERKGISAFGLTIVTNLGVVFGGKIKWLRVGDVVPGSSAAKAGLATNDEILLIDGVARNDFNRRTMLEKFFGRAPGATMTLMIRGGPRRQFREVQLKTGLPLAGP